MKLFVIDAMRNTLFASTGAFDSASRKPAAPECTSAPSTISPRRRREHVRPRRTPGTRDRSPQMLDAASTADRRRRKVRSRERPGATAHAARRHRARRARHRRPGRTQPAAPASGAVCRTDVDVVQAWAFDYSVSCGAGLRRLRSLPCHVHVVEIGGHLELVLPASATASSASRSWARTAASCRVRPTRTGIANPARRPASGTRRCLGVVERQLQRRDAARAAGTGRTSASGPAPVSALKKRTMSSVMMFRYLKCW